MKYPPPSPHAPPLLLYPSREDHVFNNFESTLSLHQVDLTTCKKNVRMTLSINCSPPPKVLKNISQIMIYEIVFFCFKCSFIG